MKYTIAGFSQKVLILYGLGVSEAEILRCIVDFWFSRKMETEVFDGREYFWLSYSFIQSELPIMAIDRKQIANKMQKFVECGLMDFKLKQTGKGSRTYFTINEDLYLPLIEYQSDTPKAEKREVSMDQGKADKKAFKEYFSWLYKLKAIEITGSGETPEGKPIVPMWGAKEASLLMKDYNQYGIDFLKRVARIFFSDTNPEIARFTRFYQKAGYAYSVFHGSLPKLALDDRDLKGPCLECGMWKGHKARCKVEVEKLDELQSSIEETKREMEENDGDGVDLSGWFEREVRLKGSGGNSQQGADDAGRDTEGVLPGDGNDPVHAEG